MVEFCFKYIICLSLIFIRETSSCNDLFDNCPDPEDAVCFTGSSIPEANKNAAMKSVFQDTIESHDEPSKTSEQTLLRFPRSDDSAIPSEEKNGANSVNEEDAHLGSFFDYPSKPTIILVLIICTLFLIPFLYSIRKYLDCKRNTHEKTPKLPLNDSIIEDFDSLHNISAGNAITTRMNHLMEFFRDPNLTPTRDYDVNISTLNLANFSFSLNSEGKESPRTHTGTPDSFECDPHPSSASDFNESDMPMESISSSDDETNQYRTNSKCDLNDDPTAVKSSNTPNKPCVEIELNEVS